jgi:hypothetical protein
MEKGTWEELEKFHKSLTEIEKSFYSLAAHEDELRAVGLRRLTGMLDLERLYPLLEPFPLELANCQRILRIVDREKYESLNALLADTKLEDLITKFSVKLRIAERERPIISPIFSVISLVKVFFF